MNEKDDVQQDHVQFDDQPQIEIDTFLRNLVMFSMNGVSVDVSLTVNGIIVCGQIASGREYFESVMSDFDRALESEDLKLAMWPLFESYRDRYLPENRTDDFDVTYIHLKDATFHSPSGAVGIPNGNAPKKMWRGKLSQVSGFTLGRFK
ncbi:hypothetical protein [uncultured Stenotrophomonas sp.]|uniref:hypothetical protein n=1 Tax=uncultured Stenotrophomonas sp. TaxID=165438 RepID=UPI0025E27319|nr:hypothetical protein [uncultured Stenotrophomonas sp.]